MDFPIQQADKKPTAAPDQFTVFAVASEEYIFCPIRKKAIKVNSKPEEKVRQWWLYRLKEAYGYSFEQMNVEVPVRVGSTEAKKKADIVVYTATNLKTPRIFVEVKKPKRKDGVEQLQVYMNATGCRLGVWSNGAPPHVYLLRIEPKESEEEATWRELRNIPAKTERLEDVDTPVTRKDLVPVTDFLSILRECEDYIKAHEGANPFDEIFKLIFAKLYDERTHLKNEESAAQFRVGVFEAPENARKRIVKLFNEARERWSGVFVEGESITLTDESLAFCVSALQKTYLFRSGTDVLGAAFEVMINPGMKGDKGQYFTPRHVIKLAIEVLDPKDRETFLDPACGSSGFLISAMEHVFAQIEQDRDDEKEISENKKDYAGECIYGMDYDRLIAKVAKAYMLIWGDGRSNIAVCDALNDASWTTDTIAKFMIGRGKTAQLKQFDLIATNPPFAGDIKADEILGKYELAFRRNKRGGRTRARQMSRDKLFLERCINMLMPLGRMAIVLPRGVLKNYSDEYVRRFILRNARVVAVVSLTGDMFKPYTNTKTCLLFLQKRRSPLEDMNEVLNDPKTVYAVVQRSGKDKSGALVLDQEKRIVSDLPEIASFIKAHVVFERTEE